MAVSEQTIWEGAPVYHMVATAESVPEMSAFYPVAKKVESFVDVKDLFPRRFNSWQQVGRERVPTQVFFDQTFRASSPVQDPISVVYYLRTLPLMPGTLVVIPMFDAGSAVPVDIHVFGTEMVDTLWGAVDTIKVKLTPKTEVRSVRAKDISIWYTNDSRRLPLRIETTAPLGSIVATLVEMRGANLPRARE
jgi:hypothetical protein